MANEPDGAPTRAAQLRAALPVEGGRVRIREWTEADVSRRHALSGIDAAWRRFNGPYFPQPSQAEIDAYPDKHRHFLRQGDATRGGFGAVVACARTDGFWGDVGWSFACEHTHWPSIGIVLYDEATWGQGVGYEALGLWADLLFGLHGFHRMDLRTWSGHRGMCRLAEKLGFVEEARFREARPLGGRRYDSVAFGILRREWEARYPGGFAGCVVPS